MRLIHYISTRYFIYTVLLAILSVPLFYLFVQQLMLHNLDEALTYQRDWIEKKLESGVENSFTSYNNSVRIELSGAQKVEDRFYNKQVFIPDDNEMVKHRVLASVISVNGKYYKVRIEKSMLEDEDLLKSISALQFVFIALLLAGTFFINRSLSATIVDPFNNTLKQLKDYRIDQDIKPVFIETKIRELNELNYSIDSLVNTNASLFQAQKAFTENASHEMQTPLAVLQSKLDLLLQTPVNKEQAVLVEELNRSIRKLQRLNRSLLLLTKIENNQFPDRQRVALKEVVAEVAANFEDLMLQKEIRFKLEVNEMPILTANAALIDILVSNLFSNALRHTNEGGAVEVVLNSKTFAISNSSASAALDKERIFQRFNKDSADPSSIGLGLEICKQIADLHHYNLRYGFAQGIHHFTIHFS